MISTRRIVQFLFLALILIGVFGMNANCERWCPFGGVETAYAYITEGETICSVGTSNFFMLGGLLIAVLLLRRAFCSNACPIGTISEWTGALAKRLGVRRVRVPNWLDGVLGLGKYLVLGVVLFYTYRAGELIFRAFDPCYALIGRHGEDITFWAYVVSAAIVVGSVFVSVPFCRWLCPLAAVMNPLSKFGLVRVRREASSCTSCGACSKACPMAIDVDRRKDVTHARCTLCLSCAEACPRRSEGALRLATPAPGTFRASPIAVAVVLVLFVAGSVGAAYLFPMPSFVKIHGERPDEVATLDLRVQGVACRGSAYKLWFFLERDDFLALDGYYRLEAWPGPGEAPIRVVYDPTALTEDDVKRAITEPYFNLFEEDVESRLIESPFVIEGFDPLATP